MMCLQDRSTPSHCETKHLDQLFSNIRPISRVDIDIAACQHMLLRSIARGSTRDDEVDQLAEPLNGCLQQRSRVDVSICRAEKAYTTELLRCRTEGVSGFPGAVSGTKR